MKKHTNQNGTVTLYGVGNVEAYKALRSKKYAVIPDKKKEFQKKQTRTKDRY